MLIKSFLAMPKPGGISTLAAHISSFSNCDITLPNRGEDALIVVMENNDQDAEDYTLLKLHESPSLEHMVLVSSFNDAL